MLVLTRRIGETIMIGDDIKITVVGISNNQVQYGIEAPREIPVHRLEIFEKIKKDKQNKDKDTTQ